MRKFTPTGVDCFQLIYRHGLPEPEEEISIQRTIPPSFFSGVSFGLTMMGVSSEETETKSNH